MWPTKVWSTAFRPLWPRHRYESRRNFAIACSNLDRIWSGKMHPMPNTSLLHRRLFSSNPLCRTEMEFQRKAQGVPSSHVRTNCRTFDESKSSNRKRLYGPNNVSRTHGNPGNGLPYALDIHLLHGSQNKSSTRNSIKKSKSQIYFQFYFNQTNKILSYHHTPKIKSYT